MSDPEGPADGSKVCQECLYVYFGEWGHSKHCSQHPETQREATRD